MKVNAVRSRAQKTFPKVHRPSGRPYRNSVEQQLVDLIEENGGSLTRQGWPDFIGVDEDGLFVVECKRDLDRTLKYSQWRVMNELSKAGIRCFTFSPSTGLQEFRGGRTF